jgi:hypothetical protein
VVIKYLNAYYLSVDLNFALSLALAGARREALSALKEDPEV